MIGLGLSIPEVAVRGGGAAFPPVAGGVTATFAADFVGGRYYFNGVRYTTFAAFNTAAGNIFARTGSATYRANGLVATAGTGVARFPTSDTGGPTGFRASPGQTERCLWNRDLTNAVWTASNVTVAKNQTGADGVANSASSLTATAGNGTVLQAITVASALSCGGAYVKRLSGSGVINMTMDGGATWTAINPTSPWKLLTIPNQTLANPTVGFQIVTNGDAIAVDFVSSRGPFPASASTGIVDVIATTTATVVQNADSYTFPWNVTTGSIIASIQNSLFIATARIVGATSDAPLFGAGDPVQVGSSNQTQSLTNQYFLTNNIPWFPSLIKSGISGSPSGRSLAVNGTRIITDANAMFGSTNVTLGIGSGFPKAGADYLNLAAWVSTAISANDLLRLTGPP